jgi:hypothetical protein
MDINRQEEKSYRTQNQQGFLRDGENEDSVKQRHVMVNELKHIPSNNVLPSLTGPGYGQSFSDTHDLSSDAVEDVSHRNVAGTTPRRSGRAACILSIGRIYLNSLPESPKYWAQINTNPSGYHSNPMGIRSIFWIPDSTDWCHEQEEMH